MDFIEGLPSSYQYNCVLVIVDKFSKYSHFIPIRHPYTAKRIAEIFLDQFYRLHGMPLAIVSDRDLVFTSAFWQEFFRSLGTDFKLSIAYRPQTDGQIERVNQSVECYLRCFISANPVQWSKWLPLCEYWYNTNWHASLGKTPFEVVYGQQPRSFGLTPSDAVASPDLQQWFHNRTVLLASVQQHLVRA